jgi:hypothetical protein
VSTWIQLNLRQPDKTNLPAIWLNLDDVRFILGDADGSVIFYGTAYSADQSWESGLSDAISSLFGKSVNHAAAIRVKESPEQIFEKARGVSAVKL